ncbi:MAG: alpha/beta hydrolase [Pseudomonadales bacterium]
MPFAANGVEVYYVDEGAGSETVFFCHGAGGNSTSWWQQVPVFAERYRCLAHDHRGFGRTVCTPEAFDVGAFAADALAVMDAAGVESAHFVCQSMGGWTGVQLALRHPDRVRSLVLSDTIGGLALPSGLASIRTMAERAQAAGAISPALGADYHLRNPTGAFLYQQLSAFNSDQEVLGLFRKMFAAEAMVPIEHAYRLSLPMLIVAGTGDLIWPPEVLHELAALLPDARVVEVDSGHSPYFENPVAFNAALDAFLASLV